MLRILFNKLRSQRKLIPVLLVFVLLLMVVVTSQIFLRVIINIIVPEHVILTKNGLAEEKEFLLEEAKRIAQRESIQLAIKADDHANLVAMMVEEQNSIGLSNIIITNHNGKVLSRTIQPASYGDYVYESTAWGRKISSGEEITSFETAPLVSFLLMSGVPIKDKTETLGGGISGI